LENDRHYLDFKEVGDSELRFGDRVGVSYPNDLVQRSPILAWYDDLACHINPTGIIRVRRLQANFPTP